MIFSHSLFCFVKKKTVSLHQKKSLSGDFSVEWDESSVANVHYRAFHIDFSSYTLIVENYSTFLDRWCNCFSFKAFETFAGFISVPL